MQTPGVERTRAYRARKRAAGFHFVNGYLREGAPKGLPPIPPHGTIKRYRSRRARCRCDECREAFNEYQRNWRNSKRGKR